MTKRKHSSRYYEYKRKNKMDAEILRFRENLELEKEENKKRKR